MNEKTLPLSLDEAKALWAVCSHDAHGDHKDAATVKVIMQRVWAFISEPQETK